MQVDALVHEATPVRAARGDRAEALVNHAPRRNDSAKPDEITAFLPYGGVAVLPSGKTDTSLAAARFFAGKRAPTTGGIYPASEMRRRVYTCQPCLGQQNEAVTFRGATQERKPCTHPL
jgi:hypothetical protein